MYSTALFTVGDDEKAGPSGGGKQTCAHANVKMERMFSGLGLQAEIG